MLDKNELNLEHRQYSQNLKGVNFNDLTDLQKENLWSGILMNLNLMSVILKIKGYDEETILAKQKTYLAKYGIEVKD